MLTVEHKEQHKEHGPPLPESAKEPERFPGGLCALAVVLAGILYYLLIFEVPSAQLRGPLGAVVFWMGKLAGGHPIIAGLLLAATLVPPLILREEAREYLGRLNIFYAVLTATVLAVALHPYDVFSSAVRSFLSQGRDLPPTIQGQ